MLGKVTDAMDRSRYLIVVLSPRAAASEWVDEEVGFWLEQRGPDQLLIVLAEGHLRWDEATQRFDPDQSDVALPVLTEPRVLPRLRAGLVKGSDFTDMVVRPFISASRR